MSIKRDALDGLFSDAVREAADWTCQRCGKQFPDRKGKDVHCSHFISRKFNSTRWYPDNAVCLCATCHALVTDDPHEHAELMLKVLGPVRLGWLKERKQQIVRYRADDKKAMRAHFRMQLEDMQDAREAGITGPLELTAYD